MARVLIAGCGYVGSALARELVGAGHEVFGLRRRIVSLPPGVEAVEADLGLPATLRELPSEPDFVFYLAGPAGRDEARYKAAYVTGLGNLLDALRKGERSPRRILFASSTAVYGESRGEWVDEETPPRPAGFSGRILLEGESLLLESEFAATVVRFGGIYGPRRTRLIDRVRTGNATFPAGAPQYTNRIHRDDCAGALAHLMTLPAPANLYLGVDAEPTDEASVLRWLAGVLGAPTPRPGPSSEERAARGNKRCRNARLLASGYRFRHPTYREGYTAVLAEVS